MGEPKHQSELGQLRLQDAVTVVYLKIHGARPIGQFFPTVFPLVRVSSSLVTGWSKPGPIPENKKPYYMKLGLTIGV